MAAFFAGCSNLFVTGYLREDLSILNSDGHEAMKLFLGSYIKGGTVTVWVDNDGHLFREPDKHLEYGTVSDKTLLTFTEKNQNGLKEATVLTDISPALLSADISEVTAEAEDLYYEHCSTCHPAPDLTKAYNTQLKGVMESMVAHTNMKIEDADLLRRYIALSINN